VWDGSITFTHSSEKWWVRALAKNFTDERYRTGSLSVGNFWIMSAYAPPRYYGLEVGTTFEF
jgi:iron complex outermembrane receptor protein